MSLFSIFEVGGSGLAAQSVRLNVTASNLANAGSVSGSDGQTYRARHPVFSAVLMDTAGSSPQSYGVKVDGVVQDQSALQPEYAPAHPKANADGFIFRSNVNTVEEMANMLSASRSYESNLSVINAAKEMLLRTLSLGQ
ncbi:MAG: flagellar basal body rod protein FlgC [Gammaproteobacteria bacterium]|nr:flagellar basal body rod protein FlgC [Gammaproteobacteria bacterium]